MSDQITTAYVEQFAANVQILTQQKGSKLRGTLREEPIRGKRAAYERIGSTVAKDKTGRASDVQYVDTPHDRRWVTAAPKYWADIIDDTDLLRTLIDPTSAYVQNAAFALGRAIDDIIISALRGSAWEGEKGDTEVVLPAAQKIAVDFGDTQAVGLTLTKIREAKRILDAADVPEDLERYLVISANQLYDMLGEDKVTSSDYAAVKALVEGQITQFLGFRWIVCNRLPKVSNTRYCLAYTSQAGLLVVAQDIVRRIDPIPTKHYATQVYLAMDMGATRMEEVQVVEIACNES